MILRIFGVCLLLTCFLNIGIAQNPERIFYSSFSPQDWDIYISKDNGNSIFQFTDHPSLDYDAVISPDGKWVIFTSERSGIPQLYVKPIDEHSPAKPLIKSNSFQDQAAFSPDGRLLAFVGSHEGNAEVYLIPFLPDTTQNIEEARNLTNHPGGDFRPAFSLNGKKLAFSSDRAHEIIPHPQFPFARQRNGDIFSMDIDGQNVIRLTDSEAWDGSPVWSDNDEKIIFYSGRTGTLSIFEMKADGADQNQIFNYEGPAVHPKILPNGHIAFTSWRSQKDFKIMKFDPSTQETQPLFSDSMDLMFYADINPQGIMAFHGGKYAPNQGVPGNFGFDGDVLAKLPHELKVGQHSLEAYGVRRAFVAPPQKGSTLLFYDASDVQSFFDVLQPMGYTVFWLPLLIITLFFTGILLGIWNRKKMSVWRYLLFSLLTLIFGVSTGAIFLYVDAIQPMSVTQIRLIMGALSLVMIGLSYWQYKKYVRRKENGNKHYRISILYSVLFGGLALFSILCTFFINDFVHSNIQFYQVDYVSGEKEPVFTLEKEPNTNPANFRVLDSKVSHDGQSFIFTTGSFRGNPKTTGDTWQYDFETGVVRKLSDSHQNDGFADISENGKMVFRSGRTGYFDIYLKTGSELKNLTKDTHRDNFPSISKQGDKIVFASDRLRKEGEYKTMDIFMMRLQADGSWSSPEKLSTGSGQNAHAHFSPDGQWVIYTTEQFGINDEQPLVQPIIFSPQMYGEIVAYNINSKEQIRLTHNKWEEGTPLWVE